MLKSKIQAMHTSVQIFSNAHSPLTVRIGRAEAPIWLDRALIWEV